MSFLTCDTTNANSQGHPFFNKYLKNMPDLFKFTLPDARVATTSFLYSIECVKF